MAVHSFDPEIAAKVGVNAAVLYQNIMFWCEKNRLNDKHIHDGKAWTYNSRQAWAGMFPYFTEKQVRVALDKLREAGLVEVGNFSGTTYNRTTWYHAAIKGECIGPKGPMDLTERANPLAQKGQTITDSKPDIKPDNSIGRATRLPDNWVPDELPLEFIRRENITPGHIQRELDKFRDYWKAQPSAKGRKLDWQATWRNWLRNSRSFKSSKPNRHQADMEWLADYVKGDDNEQA